MNQLIRLKTATPPFLIKLAFVWFVLLPGAQAVNPPQPGLPGLDTAEGQNALF